MNLRQLGHLAAVIRYGSFRKASEAIHVSQPALSLSIKGLEESLKVKLLNRSRTGVKPTVFGEALFRRMKNIEGEVRTARDELAQLQGLTQGEVRIGISPYAASQALGTLLSRFMKNHPALEVHAGLGVYSVFRSALVAGSLDFFISEIYKDRPDPALVHQTIYQLPYVIVARPDHPLARKKKVLVRDLLGYGWIYGTDLVANVDGWKGAFQASGLEAPEASFYGGTQEFYFGMLENSDLLAVTPLPSVGSLIERKRLKALDVPALRLHSPMALVSRRDTALSPAAQLLFDRMRGSLVLRNS